MNDFTYDPKDPIGTLRYDPIKFKIVLERAKEKIEQELLRRHREQNPTYDCSIEGDRRDEI